jgi:sarcosine oxidase
VRGVTRCGAALPSLGAAEAAQPHFQPSRFPVFVIQPEAEEGSGANALAPAYYGFPEIGGQPGGSGRGACAASRHSRRMSGAPRPLPGSLAAPAGFKLGRYRHLRQALADPARDLAPGGAGRAPPGPADEVALREGLAAYFPSADGPLLASSACFFTNTPDGHFLIADHPRHPQVGPPSRDTRRSRAHGADTVWWGLSGICAAVPRGQVTLVSACSGHGFKMCSGIGQLLAARLGDQLGRPLRGVATRQEAEELLAPFAWDAARPGVAEALERFAAAGR